MRWCRCTSAAARLLHHLAARPEPLLGEPDAPRPDAEADAAAERLLLRERVVACRVDGPIFLGAAHRFLDPLLTTAGGIRVAILRLRRVPVMDATGAAALDSLVARLERDGAAVLPSGLQPQPRELLQRMGVLDRLRRRGEATVDTSEAVIERARAMVADAGRSRTRPGRATVAWRRPLDPCARQPLPCAMSELADYRSRGVRALVLLHERELRAFFVTWRRALAWGVRLPPTDDPDCVSPEAMAHHVLRAARGYLTWSCEKLGLGDPGAADAPAAAALEAEADAYLEHLVERWRAALRDAPSERMVEVHTSRWGQPFTLESMLEHAVVHPMRHALQLEQHMGDDA